MYILHILLSGAHANHAGYDPKTCRLRHERSFSDLSGIRCWWPVLGIERINGTRWDMVIVDSALQRVSLETREEVTKMKAMLTARSEDLVWIEP